MKLRYWLLILLGLAIWSYYLGQADRKAYDQCVAAGVQSNETCARYLL